jgi:hypothetical protein
MSTFFRKLFVVIAFTAIAGYAGAVENAASSLVVTALNNTEFQATPTLLVSNTTEILQRASDFPGSRQEVPVVAGGGHLLTIQSESTTTDWRLLFCGLAIGVFIALRRLNSLRP